MSLVPHVQARVLTQRAAAPHQHDATAAKYLLTGRDVTGLVITLDAGLAHPPVVRPIVRQHGPYLLVVKRNHPHVHEEMTW